MSDYETLWSEALRGIGERDREEFPPVVLLETIIEFSEVGWKSTYRFGPAPPLQEESTP